MNSDLRIAKRRNRERRIRKWKNSQRVKTQMELFADRFNVRWETFMQDIVKAAQIITGGTK